MDEALLLWINQGWAQPWLDGFFWWISEREVFSFPLMVLMLMATLWQFRLDGLKLWLSLLLVIGCGDALGNVIKHASAQARPCYDMAEQVRQPGRPPGQACGANLSGMPSNHALNFFAAASLFTMVIATRLWAVSLFAIAVLVGLSRIYLGKHYPSQVLVGAGIGMFLGFGSAWLGLKYLAFMGRIRSHPPSTGANSGAS